MNRERKYRVWDNAGYMSSPFTFMDVQSKKIEFTSECIVMDYTGRKDRLGNEICEGDVIMGDFPNLVVGWNEESASFGASKTVDFSTENMYWFNNDIDVKEWEVIGNRYQNPELLNQTA